MKSSIKRDQQNHFWNLYFILVFLMIYYWLNLFIRLFLMQNFYILSLQSASIHTASKFKFPILILQASFNLNECRKSCILPALFRHIFLRSGCYRKRFFYRKKNQHHTDIVVCGCDESWLYKTSIITPLFVPSYAQT